MLLQEITSFVTVLLVTACIASAVSVLYAFGLRLWVAADGERGETRIPGHLMGKLASAGCFAACVAIVLFALWLMVPLFH